MYKASATALLLLLGAATPGYSGYLVEGQVTGNVCSNWIVFSRCKTVDIDAVRGDDGQLFTVAPRFNNVDEFNGQMCFIRLKYDGWLEWLVRKAKGPVFMTKLPGDKYEKVDPEYVSFKCSEEK